MIKLLARYLAKPNVVEWLINTAKKTPYTHIITDGSLYMARYWLFNAYPATGQSGADRKPWRLPLSIRLHNIVRPDMDRHNHDHPFNARSIILRGGYVEERDGVLIERKAGTTSTLKFGEYHKIISVQPDTWTIFITGRHRGTWGFLVEGVKVPWKQYLGLEPRD